MSFLPRVENGANIDFNFSTGYSGVLNNVIINAPAATIVIGPAALNKQRWDLVVIRETGFVLLSGAEVTVNPIKPTLNYNTDLLVMEILINENVIGDEVVIDTVDFVKKSYFTPVILNSSEEMDLVINSYLKINPFDTGTIKGFNDPDGTFTSTDNWVGKYLIIENSDNVNPLTLLNSDPDPLIRFA
jgi:hypothetical protein